MHYEIKYEWTGNARRITARNKWLKSVGIIFLSACACACMLWIVGGDWSVTLNALEEMAEDLRCGLGVKEAFSEFCIEVLHGA